MSAIQRYRKGWTTFWCCGFLFSSKSIHKNHKRRNLLSKLWFTAVISLMWGGMEVSSYNTSPSKTSLWWDSLFAITLSRDSSNLKKKKSPFFPTSQTYPTALTHIFNKLVNYSRKNRFSDFEGWSAIPSLCQK